MKMLFYYARYHLNKLVFIKNKVLLSLSAITLTNQNVQFICCYIHLWSYPNTHFLTRIIPLNSNFFCVEESNLEICTILDTR